MSTLFTFPGQGAQRAGMLHDVPHDAIVRDTLAEAGDTLGLDVLGLDTDEALRSTVAAQLCLLVAGVTMARLLIARAGSPDAVAGFSVGAYPAAVTASVLSYRDALVAVHRRARLMETAYPGGFGMVAVLGLEQGVMQALIAQVHTPQTPIYLANINAPTQLVIAGAEPALARVSELARARGAHGTKTVAISVPSHCELLAREAALLAQATSGMKVSAPRLRYYSASHARELRDPIRIAHDLANNMALPVLWHETTLLAGERGARLVVEMPPGNVLTKLATAALPDALAVAAAETRADTIAALMAREAQRDR
ncbi:MAG: malonate decarboxylase subunit epsilon [Caldimonas sp.]